MQIVGENETLVTEFVLTGCTGSPTSKMVIVAILLTSYLITVIGNALIVLVILSDTRLQNPMYLFLCNLSIVDICYTTIGIPQSIANCLVERPVTPFHLCITQMTTSTFFAAIECFLLAVMAYDRYVAVSNPLHYILIMNRTVCLLLVIITWSTAFIFIVIPFVFLPIRFCGNNEVDHLACELKAVFKLLCGDVHFYQIGIYVEALLLLVIPFSFILFSYMRIIVTIVKMHSQGNGLKAFSTCGSHLTVVVMFYGTVMFTFLLPQAKETHLSDKIVSAFYELLVPMFNPLIYTLKNKEILEALKRWLIKKR